MERFDNLGSSEADASSDPEPEPEPSGKEVIAQRIISAVEGIVTSDSGREVHFRTRIEKNLGGKAMLSVSLYREKDELHRKVSIRSRKPVTLSVEDEENEQAWVECAVVADQEQGGLRVVEYPASEPEDVAGWLEVSEEEAEKALADLQSTPQCLKERYTIGYFD